MPFKIDKNIDKNKVNQVVAAACETLTTKYGRVYLAAEYERTAGQDSNADRAAFGRSVADALRGAAEKVT